MTGAVDQGVAQVAVRGDLTVDASLDRLGVPAIWKPAPGGMALNWLSSEGGSFGVSGPSFQGTMPTDSALRLELALGESEGTVEFRSNDGSCSVTIDVASVSHLSGAFTCSGLESTDGSVVVDANGTFTATG